jgi:uncharacterized protein
VLVVVGKLPEPGRTKTRLVPPLSEGEAAELARAFLQDTCATGRALGWEQVSLVYPARPGPLPEYLASLGTSPRPQRGQGLGDALACAFADHLAEGFEQVVLIGSDTPDLPAGLLHQASRRLSEPGTDLVIGPSLDGGYYLLGMRQPHLGVFEAIAWSTDQVYAQTLERARGLGLRVTSLQSWADVDTPDDLVRLERDLRRAPPSVAPSTRQVLNQLRSTSLAETRR